MQLTLKKRALVMFICGFALSATALAFIFVEYQTVRFGEAVTAQVIGTQDMENSTRTFVQLEYIYQGSTYNIQPRYLFNSYVVGDNVPLRAYHNQVSIPSINNGFWLSLIIVLLVGLLLFFKGFRWLYAHRKSHSHEIIYLKRYGRKIHARFERIEESAQKKDGNYGKIFVLKQIDSERTFTSEPIFTQETIKWIEEHLFDIYVHPKNSKKYYIDFEKHFGQE